MIDAGRKRTAAPSWETARHRDRAAVYPGFVSCLSSFLFQKTGMYITQARACVLKTPRMAGNQRSQNGCFHAVFGTFGSQNGTPGWPKTEGPYGHHPRLSGPLFLGGDTFLKSGTDTSFCRNREETIGKDQADSGLYSQTRKATR